MVEETATTQSKEKSATVGKLTSPQGILFARTKFGMPWEVVPAQGAVCAGDLLFGLPGACVHSGKDAIRLTFRADLDRNSPYPILESAVILHDSSEFDLDFTLDRGWVDVLNIKKKGPTPAGKRSAGRITTRTPADTPIATDPFIPNTHVTDFLLIRGAIMIANWKSRMPMVIGAALLVGALIVLAHPQTTGAERADAAASGPRYTVIETQGFNLLVTDNATNKLYYYATDKDAPIGSPMKLRASLDLTQVSKEEIKITPHNLENMRKKENK
jgi:hypothetical protein